MTRFFYMKQLNCIVNILIFEMFEKLEIFASIHLVTSFSGHGGKKVFPSCFPLKSRKILTSESEHMQKVSTLFANRRREKTDHIFLQKIELMLATFPTR